MPSTHRSRQWSWRPLWVLASAIGLLAAACGGGSGGSGSDIVIGFLYSSEGPYASNSATARDGAQYAVDEINAGGGVNGRKIKLAITDARNDPQSMVTAIPKLVGEQRAMAIVGPVDSAGCDVGCVLGKNLSIPVISPGAARPGVLEPGRPFAVSFSQPDAAHSVPSLEKLMKSKGFKTAAIIRDDANAATKAQGPLFETVFKNAGVQVVAQPTFSSGDASFVSQVTSMAGKRPDVVALAAGPADAGRIAVEVRAQGMTAVLLGSGSLQSSGAAYLGGAGKAAEGTLTAAQFHPENPQQPAKDLLAKAKQAKNFKEVPLNFAYAYDAVRMVADIIRDKKLEGTSGSITKDRKAIQEGIGTLNPFKGMAGDTRFGPDGHAMRPQLVGEVKGGQFVISEITGS